MNTETNSFQSAAEMPYANKESIKNKATILFERLTEHLKSIKQDKSLFFKVGKTIYIPDIHGDFIHLIITLHRHGLLEESEVSKPRFHKPHLQLRSDFNYVFLGDFYDRAPDSDILDYWLNIQIKNNLTIFRLIGNHEMGFFERDINNHPVIFPSHDSIKDISNNFEITENLLNNISEGNILAAYTNPPILYVHSYIMNNDFLELGLKKDLNITDFAHELNKRFKTHGQYAYNIFMECKKVGKYNWKLITKAFNDDPLFNLYKSKNDISTSFLWRRTGLSRLKIYPNEIDVEIPDNVYQIVGHTPIFSFSLPQSTSTTEPFVLSAKNGTGKVQFSDIGIGYYYKSDFERPDVLIKECF